ncbi:MAG: hypothetical protein KDA92_24795, partial [Planctomycetales bacterium]|nr:hypothetical protein [Planctomycetales bacterium]
MQALLETYVNWALPANARANQELLRLYHRIVMFNSALFVAVYFYMVVFQLMNSPWGVLQISICGVLFYLNALCIRRGYSPFVCGHMTIAASFYAYTMISACHGGHYSPAIVWFTTIPLAATLLTGIRGGIVWTLASIGVVAGFYVVEYLHIPITNELTVDNHRLLDVMGEIGLISCIMSFVVVVVRSEHDFEQSLTAALSKAQEADQAKTNFLANMSHEIRTPMTAILGYSELMDTGNLDPEGVRDALGTIKRNGEHLLTIINDVLDLSKIEAGRLTVEQIAVSPHQLLSDTALLMDVRAAAKGLVLSLNFDSPLPRTISSDPTRLRQILVNLIGNAIKFTEIGGVHIASRIVDEQVPIWQIDVTDTGIGLSVDQQARMFEVFNQADTSTTRSYGGTGLGLAISKRLAALLDGDIVVLNSRPGAGTTMRLTLPVPSIAGVPLLLEPTVPKTNRTIPHTDGKLPDRCRILLAEDGHDNQRLLSFVLKKAGATVTVVDNGFEAKQLALAALIAGEPFDV